VPVGSFCSGRSTPAHTANSHVPPRACLRHSLGITHEPLLCRCCARLLPHPRAWTTSRVTAHSGLLASTRVSHLLRSHASCTPLLARGRSHPAYPCRHAASFAPAPLGSRAAHAFAPRLPHVRAALSPTAASPCAASPLPFSSVQARRRPLVLSPCSNATMRRCLALLAPPCCRLRSAHSSRAALPLAAPIRTPWPTSPDPLLHRACAHPRRATPAHAAVSSLGLACVSRLSPLLPCAFASHRLPASISLSSRAAACRTLTRALSACTARAPAPCRQLLHPCALPAPAPAARAAVPSCSLPGPASLHTA
jgi:hypothetical protein